MNSIVKYSFIAVGCSTLALLLYFNLFGFNIGGTSYKGGIRIAGERVEKSMASFYNTFTYSPYAEWDKDTGDRDLLKRASKYNSSTYSTHIDAR